MAKRTFVAPAKAGVGSGKSPVKAPAMSLRPASDPAADNPLFWSQLADRFNIPRLPVKAAPVEQTDEGPKLKVMKKGFVNTPHVKLELDPARAPRKWAAADGHPQGSPILKRGMIVFYHDLRYWVERVPASWKETHAVWISDEKIHPDVARMAGDKRESFVVHADLLTEAPQPARLGSALPTVASAARAERAKQGVRDVGDEVAVLLRGAASLDDVYRIAAKYLGVKEAELRKAYGHLNPGQQRMNCGNKMRFKWKKDNGLAGRKAR